MSDMWTVGRKKLEDTFSSKKFLLIIGLFLLMSLASVYLGVQSYQEEMKDFREGDIYGNVPDKPTLVDVFKPMVGLNLPLAAGVLALLLSYSSISREREQGTIELLLSYPLYRDEIINGKFFSGLFTVATALLIAFTASSGLAVFMTGVLPTLEGLYRLMFLWQGSVVYMAFFFGLGTLFSVIFRSSRRSLIAGMLVLLAFLATPLVSGMAATFIYPMDVQETMGAYQTEKVSTEGSITVRDSRDSFEDKRRKIFQKRESFKEKVARISPVGSYKRYSDIMLGKSYKSNSGLKPGVWTSLSSALGYLVFLISETMLMFAAAYGVFMRQDL